MNLNFVVFWKYCIFDRNYVNINKFQTNLFMYAMVLSCYYHLMYSVVTWSELVGTFLFHLFLAHTKVSFTDTTSSAAVVVVVVVFHRLLTFYWKYYSTYKGSSDFDKTWFVWSLGQCALGICSTPGVPGLIRNVFGLKIRQCSDYAFWGQIAV